MKWILSVCLAPAIACLIACSGSSLPFVTIQPPAPAPIGLEPDVLAIYNKSGGIAGIDETLTVHRGGLLELTRRGENPKSLMVDHPLLIPLTNTIEQPDFDGLELNYQTVGADLIAYTITARDSQGNLKTIRTMDTAKHPFYLDLLIIMFENLSEIVAKNG